MTAFDLVGMSTMQINDLVERDITVACARPSGQRAANMASSSF